MLVIDDEAPIRLLCRVNLEAEGWPCSRQATACRDSSSPAERPDVILLDVMMPGLDGWAVASAAREPGHDRDPDHLPHCPRRVPRPGARPRHRRDRLHHEAVQPRRAGAARPRRAGTARARRAGRAAPREAARARVPDGGELRPTRRVRPRRRRLHLLLARAIRLALASRGRAGADAFRGLARSGSAPDPHLRGKHARPRSGRLQGFCAIRIRLRIRICALNQLPAKSAVATVAPS